MDYSMLSQHWKNISEVSVTAEYLFTGIAEVQELLAVVGRACEELRVSPMAHSSQPKCYFSPFTFNKQVVRQFMTAENGVKVKLAADWSPVSSELAAELQTIWSKVQLQLRSINRALSISGNPLWGQYE